MADCLNCFAKWSIKQLNKNLIVCLNLIHGVLSNQILSNINKMNVKMSRFKYLNKI